MSNGLLTQVALYKFRNAKECRVTESNVDRNLHAPVENHKLRDLLQLRKTPKAKVGAQFLFNKDLCYSCEGNTVRIVFAPEKQTEEADVGSYEDSRCAKLVTDMSTLYPDCTIKVWSNNYQWCPFQGGGDIKIHMQEHV